MKYIPIILLIFYLQVSCDPPPIKKYSLTLKKGSISAINDSIYSFGKRHDIFNFKRTLTNQYQFYARIIPDSGNFLERLNGNGYFMLFNTKGKLSNIKKVNFNKYLSDYVEINNCYYVVLTDRKTMGGNTTDYLCKYDSAWTPIWSKKIGKAKYPDGTSKICLADNNELLLVSDYYDIKDNLHKVSLSRYSLPGNLVEYKLLSFDEESPDPVFLTETDGNNYILGVDLLHNETSISDFCIIKLNNKKDTLWSKRYKDFYHIQTVLNNENEIIFAGKKHSDQHKSLNLLSIDTLGNINFTKKIEHDFWIKRDMIKCKENYVFAVYYQNYTVFYLINKKGETLYKKELSPMYAPFLFKGDSSILLLSTTPTDTVWSNKITISKIKITY